MKLQTLYKTAKTGKTQTFDIEVQDDVITVTWGALGGKLQTKTTKCTPKNVGRSNESSGASQAILEANAIWTKKQKANYSTSASAPTTVYLPMKVNDYHDFKHKVVFPAFSSVKLNGVNCEYRIIDGKLRLLSRGGEDYPIPAHQAEEALRLLDHLDGISINGEMYCHGEHLQDIMAATKKHNTLTPKLKFHIFDFPNAGGTYEERCTKLYPAVAELDLQSIVTINVGVVEDHDDIIEQHDDVVAEGYEGLVVRNRTALYEYNTRSLDVFKVKAVQDAEFRVMGYKLDKNGHAVFECLCNHRVPMTNPVPNGISTFAPRFNVKLRGTNEERLVMATEAGSYIGKFLKVEYETLSKDGIPLKPVGVMFRTVDVNGEANE